MVRIPARRSLRSLGRHLLVGGCLALALFGTFEFAWGKQNAKGLADDIRRAEKDIAAAKDKVQAARKQASDARSQHAKASAALERSIDHAADVRRMVEAEHDGAPALVAVRRALEGAKEDYESALEPVRQKLAANADYAAAVRERDSLKSRLANAPADERESLSKQYAAAMAAARNLETSAVNADVRAKGAKEKVVAAEAQVQQAIAKRNEAVARDARLRESHAALDKAKEEAGKAKRHLEMEARQLADAERKLKQEEQRKHNLQQKKKANNKPKNK